MTIEEHYKAIGPRLTNWLVASGSSHEEACDLVQDVFIRIWKMRDDLRDSDAAISGLAFTIARNLRKNLARDKKRVEYREEITEEDGGVTGPSMLPSDASYLRSKLRIAFSRLPPTLRDAYTMFQIGELSIRDIARETGATESLVKVRIFRAKQRLREILTEIGVTY